MQQVESPLAVADRPANSGIRPSMAVALVAFVPRLLTAGHHLTYDEIVWMQRTVRYSDALTTLDLAGMTAARGDQVATLPGVPTMIVGSAARLAYGIGGRIGLIGDEPFSRAWSGLHSAQLMMAITTSLLIGLLVWLTWHWLGALPALTAGVLLATEPLMVAHGAVLHTDELLGLLGACTVVLLARLLGRGGPPPSRLTAMAVAAGVLAGLTALTKLSSAAFVPGVALLVGWVAWRRIVAARRTGASRRLGLASVLEPVATIVLVGAATIAVLWPALVVAPGDQLGVLRTSANLADAGQFGVFRGELTFAPPAVFYFVTTPFRMTPWFLIATLILVPVALADRGRRRQVASLLVVIVGVVVVLTLTPKKIDRYIVEVVPLLAVLVGIGAASALDLLRGGRLGTRARHLVERHRRGLRLASAAVVVGVVGHSVLVAPWGGIYFNPLLGGATAAEQRLVVGWGEGIRAAGDLIARREDGHCADLRVAMGFPFFDRAIPCGYPTPTSRQADYRIVYINDRQLDFSGRVAEFRATHTPIAEVRERGVLLAEIYDLRQPG